MKKGRQPPSPFALPIIGHIHLVGSNIQRSFHDLSQLYGPVFRLRLGPKGCVVVSSPELAKEFLRTHEHEFAYRNQNPTIKLLTYDASFAFAPYGIYMKFMKKMCINKLVGDRNLSVFEPIRTLEIHRFLQHLMAKAEAGETANLTKELMRLSSNIISQMTWSSRCADNEDDALTARTVVREVSQLFGEFDVSDIIWFCRNFDFQGVKKRAESTHKRYDALLERIISEREQTRNTRGSDESVRETNDFLDMLLVVKENHMSDVELSRNHIKAIILDLLTAATDTIAIILEWALSELINNPRVLKKAQDEIDEVVGIQRLAKESDIPNLTYLKAVIKETFRLHPPNPMLIRTTIKDCNVAGYHIPSNTMLFVNIWSFGRNPNYWDNPLEFRPERFLDDESNNPLSQIDISGQHFQLLPFGTGRRGCPGMPLAMKEVPTVLSLLVQCFHFATPSLNGDKIDMAERPGLTAPRANDLMLLLKPRSDLAKLISV